MASEILHTSTTRQSVPSLENLPYVLSVATESDREVIYRMRHEVYARELGQHATTPAGSLRDALDDWNVYLVAKFDNLFAVFISLPPPSAEKVTPPLHYS